MTNLVFIDVLSEGLPEQVDLEQVLLGWVDLERYHWGRLTGVSTSASVGVRSAGWFGAWFAGAGGGTGGSAIFKNF